MSYFLAAAAIGWCIGWWGAVAYTCWLDIREREALIKVLRQKGSK